LGHNWGHEVIRPVADQVVTDGSLTYAPPMADEPGVSIQVPLSWVGIDELTAHLANQFMIQRTEDGWLLTVGQALAPAFIGTPEEQRAQASELTFVPVRPLGRFSMTEDRVRQLVALLKETLERAEEQAKEQ
jgi:hypothetical protein